MDERRLLGDIEDDLRVALKRQVLYLEGRTDPQIFFALLGEALPAVSPRPDGHLHQGVLVRGLGDKGAGKIAVQQRVELAARYPRLRGRVFGITDGDGQSHAQLLASFTPPYTGPLFTWPTYSIENQLVLSGWPAAWGTAPDWPVEMRPLAPYVAVNRLLVELLRALEPLNFPKYLRPNFDQPLRSAADIEAVLLEKRHQIAAYEIDRFRQEVALVEGVMHVPAEAHALVNGKWLIQWSAKQQKLSEEACRAAWCEHVARQGGMSAVTDLWKRVTQAP